MKTELALSFIFDPTRAEDLERITDMLSYAAQRGITPVRGDLDRLDGVRQALGPGSALPVAAAVASVLQCEHCQRKFQDALVLEYHLRHCQTRVPPYRTCPACGRAHIDTAQGRAQHRRRCPATPRPTSPSKEVSCDA